LTKLIKILSFFYPIIFLEISNNSNSRRTMSVFFKFKSAKDFGNSTIY
jgi:hypothetical protein